MTDEVKVATAAQDAGELAALKRRVEELEAAAKPKAPFVPVPHQHYDPTANATMSPGTWAELAAAVPGGLVRSVVGDFRAGPALPKSQADGAPKPKGTGGFVEAVPLGPPPGVELCDQMLDVQDAVDRLALAKRLGGGGE
jgi:hypothetical protein